MEKKWLKDANELRRDVDAFRDYFERHKKCTCPVDDCKHLDKALAKILGDRTNDLCRRNFDIGIKIYYDVMKNNKVRFFYQVFDVTIL